MNWTLVPPDVTTLQGLSSGAKMTYGMLRGMGGDRGVVTIDRQDMAVHLAVTPRQISRYVQELERRGLLRVTVNYGRRPNTYTLLPPLEGAL